MKKKLLAWGVIVFWAAVIIVELLRGAVSVYGMSATMNFIFQTASFVAILVLAMGSLIWAFETIGMEH